MKYYSKPIKSSKYDVSYIEKQVQSLCANYNYKVTEFEVWDQNDIITVSCTNKFITIKAEPNYNNTATNMRIVLLGGRVIDNSAQVDKITEAIELQSMLADIIGARAL